MRLLHLCSLHRLVLLACFAFFVDGAIVLSLAPEDLFDHPVFQTTAFEGRSEASGDFNGDGKRDLAVCNMSANLISIFLGNGDGFFAPPSQISVTTRPEYLVVDDFNGDGAEDLATVNASEDISIVLGNGDGSFLPENHLSGVGTRTFIAKGDFNGDGRTDLVATGASVPYHIVVLLGAGDGTFPVVRDFSTGGYPASIAVGDLNGDRVQDLVTANSPSYPISVLLGLGDGTFNPETRYDARGWSVALGDFNGDGHQDAALATGTGASVLLGLGDGTLAPGIDVAALFNPREINAGDFDRDGRQDLAVVDRGQNSSGESPIGLGVFFFRGTGNGHFDPAAAVGSGRTAIQAVFDDFTGDGVPDLAVLAASDLRVISGTGTGWFAPRARGDAGALPQALVKADMNGDGRADLVTANPSSDDVSVLISRGDGGFDPPIHYITGNAPVAVAVSDLNADGNPDIVTVNPDPSFLSVLLGRPGGGFDPFTQYPSGSIGHAPRSVVIADVNSDGRPDLIAANEGYRSALQFQDGYVSVLPGLGDGTFGAQQSRYAGPDPYSIATGDFDGDGRIDLAVASKLTPGGGLDRDVWILLGLGDGTFSTWSRTGSNFGARSVAVGDFNEDGHQDLAVAHTKAEFNYSSYLDVMLGNGSGSFDPPTRYETDTDSEGLVVADFDHDGHQDLAVANLLGSDVSLRLGAGDGSFGAQSLYAANRPIALAVMDVNSDDGPDLVAGGPSSPYVWIYRNLHPLQPIVDITVSLSSPGGRGSGTVTWTTKRENDISGFNVITLGNTGDRTQINVALIPCEECITGLGHTYMFYVPKHRSAKNLYIEAVHADGTVQVFGPAKKTG